MSKWHGGKGSNPRKVDAKKFSEGWDKIFGSKDNINSRSNKSKVQ